MNTCPGMAINSTLSCFNFYKLELKFATSNTQFNLKSVSEIWSIFEFCEFRRELGAARATSG